MNRLGVIGTMVWDTILGRGTPGETVEEWGGIAYALAALEAALPTTWEIVPLIKVGSDLAADANAFLRALTRRSAAARFIEVAAPNNRVTLRYVSHARRTERLVGGVPPWTWSELGPMVTDLDAMYVNFISGFEMTLDDAHRLRAGYRGPIYADLHSLLLGVAGDGTRVPRALPNLVDWFAGYDAVQLNDDELALIAGEPLDVAARAFAAGIGLLVVTLGPRGAVYFTTDGFRFAPGRATATGPIRSARIAAPAVAESGDPTGCGDVFGATLVAGLLDGRPVEQAVAEANALAARNVRFRGAGALQYHLRGEIVPR